MKRKSFSAKALLTLIAVLFSLTGARAETLTVYGNATDDSDYVPVYGYYGDAYNKCEFVVPASELNAMEGGTISQMTFYLKSPANEAWTGAFQVFLKEVDYTAISEFSGTEGATVVYEGTLDGTQSTMTINFSKNHVYKGGNLLVGVYQTATGNYKKATFTGADVDNSSITGYNYSNFDKISPTQRDFIPKTTFTYTPSSGVYAKPKDLTISNLTAHEVTISWTAPAGTVSGYAYQLKKETEEWGTEETTITNASVTLTGLKAGGAYNFRVKALYGENASVYVSVNFTTDCGMATLPFEESWDDGIGCWTVVNNSSPDNAPSLDVTDGNNIFCFSSYNGADVYDQFLISPEFDGSKAIDLEFNYCSSPNGAEYFKVGYSTTTNNINAFTWRELIKTEETSWALWEGTFPQGTKYVAIHYASSYSYHLYVDNLLFTEHSDLIKPTDLAVSEVFGKSAKLSWTENGTATAWQICLNNDMDNLIDADSNPFTLTGLTPETDYVASVRAVEGDKASKWSEGVQFTTGPLYTAPTDLTVEPLATSATVSWWCNPEATSFVVQYAYHFTHSGPIWITAEGNANPCILEGLNPETTYHVRVKAIYGTEGESTWTVTKFTTLFLNSIPWDVVATPDCTTASIEWSGISDSYEVKYRTASIPGEASFFENFENGLGAWTVYTDGTAPQTDGWYTFEASGNGLSFDSYSGTYCAGSWSWKGIEFTADNWLITPKVTFGKLLKFWVRTNPGFPDSYEVLLSTTGNAEKDFTVTLQAMAAAPASDDWTEVVIDLSDYTGQEGYIAIHHQDYNNNYLVIDDFGIYIEDTPAGEWTTVPTTETSVELTGLMENTEYEYTIIGIKNNVANEGTAIASFTTLISNPVPSDIAADLAADGATLTWEGKGDSYNVRYRVAANRNVFFEESFEGGEIPEGWTTVDNDGDGFNWGVNTYSTVSGLYAATSASFDNDSYSALHPDNWLITPLLDLKGTLGVWLRGQDTSYAAEHFAIYLSTTGNDIADFLTTESVPQPKIELLPETEATSKYIEYTADLSAYEGQQGYIAIRHFNVSDMFVLDVDDFSIFEPIPAGEWQEMAVTEATASFNGLATNNAYEYQIQSVKDGKTSDWSEINDFALVTLDSNADNNSLISKFDGKQAYVTLANRNFYVDDTWNTICLPFNLSDEQVAASPLAGADIRTLNSISTEGETVTLNFYPEGVLTDIEGGYPYIIKWAAGSDIVNPEFANVTITKDMYFLDCKNKDESVAVHFIGTYAKKEFTADDPSILFVGEGNKLNYPLAGASVGACRGYFALYGVTAGDASSAKQFIMNFGDDDATSLNEELRTTSEEFAAKEWYDLSGRKLAGKPNMKGIYVNGGRKVTVK